MVSDTAHIRAMAERLQNGITSQCDGVVLNGPQSTEQRYVGNMNLSFSYVEGESLIMGLKVRTLCFFRPLHRLGKPQTLSIRHIAVSS